MREDLRKWDLGRCVVDGVERLEEEALVALGDGEDGLGRESLQVVEL